MISITYILFNPTEQLKIQLSVGLNNNEYFNLVNVFETNKGTYISINPNITVPIKYNNPNKEWSRTDVVYITDRNIYALKMGLRSFYKTLMREDMFIYNDKGYVVEINTKGGKDDGEVIPLTKGQFLRLEPAILYDKQGNSLPGVMMRINIDANAVDLSIDEYEAMMNIFESINIRQEGMVLLQTYLLLRKNPFQSKLQSPPPQTNTKEMPRRSLFDRKQTVPTSNEDEFEYVKTPVKSNAVEFMNPPKDIVN